MLPAKLARDTTAETLKTPLQPAAPVVEGPLAEPAATGTEKIASPAPPAPPPAPPPPPGPS